MIVRVSAPMIDSNIKGFNHTSSVQKDKKLTGFKCNAPKQDNKCLDCRACWDPEIKNIVYNMIMKKSFDHGLKKIADAFEKRAIDLFKKS